MTEHHLINIVDKMLDETAANLQELGMALHVTEEAKKKLSELGYNPVFGARPLRRVIQEYVEDGITDLVLDNEHVEQIRVDVKDNQITIEKAA